MDKDGKIPDSDAPTFFGEGEQSPEKVGTGTQTPPPVWNSSDAATLLDAGPVTPSRDTAKPKPFDNQTSLPGKLLGGRYQILRVLGEGGMGAVYQARDLELERVIALKVIRPELASNASILQRFKQELILARNITHKSVIRIYDLGEADGIKFITMEYVEGDDLRSLLRSRGKLPPAETVAIIQQICRALEVAHGEGVIHRDLKPQNVMLDPQGRVVVMDFGLARSFESNGMTQTGALVGTLEYMSPEQAMGAELDQRSDLFAVGLIFYELLTGKVPYKADTAIASLMRRTQERAIPASDTDSTVPKPLCDIVSKCLERNPKERFHTAHEILQALQAWEGNSTVSPLTSQHRPISQAPRSVQISLNLPSNRWGLWLPGLAIVLVLFFAVPATRHLVFHPTSSLDTASTSPTDPGIPNLSKGKYLAVLPIRVMGDEKTLGYVAEGLVDALSAKMFQLQEVHVASSSAVEKAAAKQQSPEKMARALGVNLILQGTVQGAADKIRIVLNLDDVASGRRLWSEEFSGVPQDLLTLEDHIYGNLVQALNLKPSNEEMARSGVHPTENTTAYDLYLKGRDALRGSQGNQDTKAAINYLENALHQDPNFALAYTGLADANLRLYDDTKDSLYAEKALSSAQKSESLNANLPEVHLSLGSVYNATGRTTEAIAELKRALALAPNSDDAYRRLGDAYKASGRKQDAINVYQSAVAVNPYYWNNHNTLGGAFFQFGENEKALQEYQRVTELASDNPIGYQNLGAVYIRMGRWNDAIPVLQKANELQPDADTYSNLGTAYFILKRYDDAIKMYEKAVEMSPKDEQLEGNLADAYRSSGRSDQALHAYDTAIKLAFQQLQVNPKSASVTGDLALYYMKKADAPHALQYIRQARTLDPSDLQLIYTEAQIYALADKSKEALSTLKDAFQKGYSPDEALNDPELAKLKDLPEFTKLLNEYSKKTN
ncbi:MAG TPA: protein kinase [Terriglobales bacterium]|nr:protein kinase [Terriglobales bacterium]